MGSIGDVTRGFSVLPPIKQQYPQVRITWLVEPKCEGLVRLHPLIDQVIVFNRSRGIRGIPALWKELKKQQFDVVLDMQRHFKSGLFSRLAPAKRRIGFHPRNTKEFNHWFHKEYIDFFPESVSKITNYQAFIKAIGGVPCSSSGPFIFGLESFDGGRYPALSSEADYIGVVLGSSWPSKDVPKNTYLVLLRRCLETFPDYSILLFGDKTHVELAKTLSAELNDPRIFSSAGATDLGGLCTLLGRCKVVVGPDSGPGHICSAVGTPYISCFGPTDPRRVAPAGNEARVIQSSVGCAPCWRRECPGLDTICMKMISIEKIISQVYNCTMRERSQKMEEVSEV
jgi:ADP-heptose:LPS heptosyltransferase